MKNVIEKYNLKNISKRLESIALAGALAFASVGCGKKNEVESSEVVTEVTTTEAVNTVDENSKYYNEIVAMEDNIVSFINNALAKGLFDYELTEDMKTEIAEQYLNYYLALNQNEISGKAFYILNQDGDLNSIDILNKSMIAEEQIQKQTVISQSGTELNYADLIIDENDREMIQKLADIIASMHTAIKNEDKEQLDSLTEEVIEIKNSIIEDNDQNMITYNPMTLDLVLMLIDSADMLSNGAVITNEEDRAQILNTSFVKCVNGEFVTSMTEERVLYIASEMGIENYQNMSKEEILEAISSATVNTITSEVSIRSNLRAIAKAMLAETICNTQIGEYSSEYSKANVVKYIADRIDLSLQVIPTETFADFVNSNPYGFNNYQGDILEIGTTTETTTADGDSDLIPDEVKDNDTTETIVDPEGNELSLTEAEIREADSRGANQAIVDFPNNKNSNPYVAGKSDEWNRIYRNAYNSQWSYLVSTSIGAQTPSTEEIVPVSPEQQTTQETIIEQGNVPSNNVPVSNDSNVEYIPVNGEEIETVIEEGYVSSTNNSDRGLSLNELRELNRFLTAYAANYNATVENVRNNGSRRV